MRERGGPGQDNRRPRVGPDAGRTDGRFGPPSAGAVPDGPLRTGPPAGYDARRHQASRFAPDGGRPRVAERPPANGRRSPAPDSSRGPDPRPTRHADDRPATVEPLDDSLDEPADDLEPEAATPPTARPPSRRRATDGARAVDASGAGRPVTRARAEARTAKAPARTEKPARTEEPAALTMTARRPRAEHDDVPDERLRADHIDETLTRLTAAHAGLVLSRTDDEEDREDGGADDSPPLRARPAVRAGRYAVAAIAFLLVLTAGLGWAGRTRLDGALTRVAAVDVAPDVVDAAAQTGDENVLVLATDGGGSAGATTRANTVTVVHRDARGDRSVAVTLPPQLEITRPPCERWDPATGAYLGQTVPAEPRTTFDSAYAVGGPRCATRAAQQVTGLAITRFVAVDLAATSALVEVVGGVQVCVERPVLDSVLGPVTAAAGTDTYNGARAATLVRAADVRGEPAGGAALVQRQQRVLAAALERALSPAALLHPGRVGGLLPALGTTVVSTGTGVADLLALSRGLGEVRAVPVEPRPNSRNNIELRETETRALFAAVRADAALPAPDVAATSSAPADVTTDVLNASGRDGLAAEVAGTLGDLGFRTGEVRNADQPALDTVVRFSPDRADQAQLLAAALPSATAVPDPGTSGVLQLVLGRSFDGTVRASAAPESAEPDDPAPPSAACG